MSDLSSVYNRPRLISVLSGKGGVGKSVISFNLAERMAAAGRWVLLVDADFTGGNQHILANVDAPCGVADLASGELTLAEATTPIAERFDLLAMTDLPLDSDLQEVGPAAELAARIREQAAGYDFVLIDHCSGVSEAMVVLAHTSDICLMIAVPELTSICNAYGLYKHLVAAHRRIDTRLVINWARGEFEAPYIAGKITALAQRFLTIAPIYLGSLPEDPAVRSSIASQTPLAATDPAAPIVAAIEHISQLIGNPADSPRSERSAFNNRQTKVLTAAADNRE